ncbi:MAG: hypothetical protein HC840_05565 [Leptolyngbyaceae cyanobacterium RM2_2_4]|nr:hypothetical protein [Leptolyngbyaceae cyanobacterium SM1_4_3]NJO49020.1 hypothetical protein [Leptolyngbyaceae cyanobacterium RM2_2_4]
MLQPKEPAKELGQQARQQYLMQARQIVGQPNLDYSTLYQRFAENDWAAIKLDEAVVVAALKAGITPKTTVNMLHQGPYVQHQVHVRQVPVLAMSQYARGTVIQVMHQLLKRRHDSGCNSSVETQLDHQSGMKLS